MLRIACYRIGLAALGAAMLGCAGARSTEVPGRFLQEAPSMHTVTVSRDQPAHLAAESLRIELVSVKDDRCPEGVNCIWAGHAAVTLTVTKAGGASKTVTIGTQAPPHMRLPYDAAYEDHVLHLVRLEPGNTQAPATRYRATVTVSPGRPENLPEAQPLDR